MKKCYILDVDDVLVYAHSEFVKWAGNICFDDKNTFIKYITEFNRTFIHSLKPILSSVDFLKGKDPDDVYMISACGNSDEIIKKRIYNISLHYPFINTGHLTCINYENSKNDFIKKIINNTNYDEYIFVDDHISRVEEALKIPNLKIYLFNDKDDFNYKHNIITNIISLKEIR